jgi:hypothetical protein
MVLRRTWHGLTIEEFWFDEERYRAPRATIALLRTSTPCTLSDCVVPEKTLYLDLDRSADAIFEGFQPRAKHSIRNSEKTATIIRASSREDRELFYNEYRLFAQRKKLLLPAAAEETELDIFLARNGKGELVHAVACAPFPHSGLYRYRYSVSIQKSQANAGCLWQAILYAKNNGFAIFDFGGIPSGKTISPKMQSICFFKTQFGGREVDTYLFARANSGPIKIALKVLGRMLRKESVFSRVTSMIVGGLKTR